MIRHTRKLFVRRRLIALLIFAFHASSRNAYAQLDPLLALKYQQPTVLLLVDTSARMQRDADEAYYDPQRYTRSTASGDTAWQANIGVSAATASQYYYRKFINLQPPPLLPLGVRYQAERVETVGDLQPGYSTFLAKTRIEIAKQSLLQLVEGNMVSTRFSLLRLGQVAAASHFQTTSPVLSNLSSQQSPGATETSAGLLGNPPAGWKITRNTNLVSGSSLFSVVGPLIPSDAIGGNVLIRDAIANSTGTTGALVPLGLGDLALLVTPIATLLQSVISALVNWLVGAPVCANVAIVMVVGGGEPLSVTTILVAVTQIVGLVFGHRIPVHVASIAAPAGDHAFLQQIADMSGGRFTNVTKAQIEATTPGQPVPELAEALNWAVQHTFLAPSEFNGASSATALRNLTNEHQATSPITGTVNLRYRADITGTVLPNTHITNTSGTVIPQRSNFMVTSGFSLPGFDAKLRAFRVYKPVADITRPGGYRFSQDGTRLWVAAAPAAGSRNIFTVLPNGTMTAFSEENASTLAPYLGPVNPAALIQNIRSRPIGAIVGSTPAIMDPPSLDPPPDPDYGEFRELHEHRRSIVFVGANDGMLHAIDARTGLEVWAFIPFNLLPKLRTVTWGHGLDAGFRYMVDSSPKLSDVKVGTEWRTFLYFGQSAGGTFYTALDVTLSGMDETFSTNDSPDALLSFFATATRIPWAWSFPRLTSFDHTIAPYGDVSSAATAVEKSVGETWSDPAVGRMGSADGGYGVFVGSGFLTYTKQQQANRGGTVAGRTFYVLDAATGDVLANRDVGSDNVAESIDDCRADGNCMRSKNALQMDPVATGPYNTRHITKVYIGDLDGRVWRMNLTVAPSGAVTLSTPTKLYDNGQQHPLYGSMAAVNVGSSQTYLFFGTGSDLLSSKGVSVNYFIRIVLDSGTSTGALTFSQSLAKTDNSGDEEKMTGFPAVAGDVVFFTTTTQVTTTPCTPFNSNLYGFTFIGGPAYDTNNDGQIKTTGSKADTPKLLTRTNARVTSPFIVDQHLYFGSGNKVEVFGDPNDFNNGIAQAGVRVLSWREVQ